MPSWSGKHIVVVPFVPVSSSPWAILLISFPKGRVYVERNIGSRIRFIYVVIVLPVVGLITPAATAPCNVLMRGFNTRIVRLILSCINWLSVMFA